MAEPWKKYAPAETAVTTPANPNVSVTGVPLGADANAPGNLAAKTASTPWAQFEQGTDPTSVADKAAQQHMTDLYSPDSQMDPLSKATSGIADFARMIANGVTQGGSEWLRNGGKADTTDIDALSKAYGPAGVVDNVIGQMGTAAMTPGAMLSTGLKATATGMGEGAINTLASSYFNTGEIATPQQLAIGSVLGAVGGATGYTLGKVITRPPIKSKVTADQLQVLNDNGIDVRVGQLTRDPKALANEAASDGVVAADAAQQSAFSKAALDKASIIAPDGLLDPTALKDGFTRTGQQMDVLAQRNPLQGPEGVKALGQMWAASRKIMSDMVGTSRTTAQVYPNPVPQVMRNAFDEIVKSHTKGSMAGAEYQKLASELAEAARKNPTAAPEIYAMRSAIDDAQEAYVQKTNPGDVSLLKAARKQWVNLLTIENAFSKSGVDASRGYITPSNLSQAVKTISGKKGYTRETNDLASLGRAGQSLLIPSDVASQGNSRQISELLGKRLSTGLLTSAGMASMLGSGVSNEGLASVAGGVLLPEALSRMSRTGVLRTVNSPLRFNNADIMGARTGLAASTEATQHNPFANAMKP